MDNTEKNKKESLIRIAKRDDLSFAQRALVRVLCIGSAVLTCIVLLWIIGLKDPFPAVAIIFEGTFKGVFSGNFKKLIPALQATVMLLGIAVALAPAYRMKFWNVGAQGQVLMGALGACVVMIYGSDLPNGLIIFLSFLTAVGFGAIWGMIPALFKAKWNTNETLFTLMMNYIAIQLVSFCTMIWRGKNSSMSLINSADEKGWLPHWGGNDMLLPLVVVLILVVLMWAYLSKTKHGYELTVIGDSVNTARYTGIKVKWVIIRTLLLSGALCGLMGFLYAAGIEHKISTDTSGSYGFTAIIVCWLSSMNPLIMGAFSFLIVFLDKGAMNLKNAGYAAALNEYSCELLVFVLLVSIMLAEFFIRYRLLFSDAFKEKAQSGWHKFGSFFKPRHPANASAPTPEVPAKKEEKK
jgi:simple sugar transport system permease protein